MKRNILFIEPKGARTNFFINSNYYPLLGPVYLATQLKEKGYSVRVIKESFVSEAVVTGELLHADILVLTLLTNTAYRGYALAQLYKSLRPDGWVIAGGIHPSMLPEEAIRHVDQVATGEGSLAIEGLVNRDYKEPIIHCPQQNNLDERPIPDFSLMLNSKKIQNIPVMTSLGCPFGCTFCCVTEMYGRKYRYQGPEKTIGEIRHHLKQMGNKGVFFYDDNFCANKKISLELFDQIERNNLKFQWGCQVRSDIAKDGMFVKRMAEAGCNRVSIGFESINDRTLRDFKKNETIDDIEHAIRVFHDNGITIHGMFIFGTDNDDREVFSDTVNFCVDKKIETAQFLSITPFPGTEYHAALDKKRLLHRDWDILDGFHVNMAPEKMTAFQLMSGILASHEAFYSWKRIFAQVKSDLLFIFNNRNRSLKYRIQKLARILMKNIGFRMMLRTWKRDHADYHAELKQNSGGDSVSIGVAR